MIILDILLSIYLIIGFLYASYILLFGADYWYWFPVNMIFGPIVIVYDIYLVTRKKRKII